eukprot:11726767-Ditylum_brightwellii.AAC.1
MEDSYDRVLQSTGFSWIEFTIQSAVDSCPGSLPFVAIILWDKKADIDLTMLDPDNEIVYSANKDGIYGFLTADLSTLGPKSIVIDRNPVVAGQVFKLSVWCFSGCNSTGAMVNFNIIGNSVTDFFATFTLTHGNFGHCYNSNDDYLYPGATGFFDCISNDRSGGFSDVFDIGIKTSAGCNAPTTSPVTRKSKNGTDAPSINAPRKSKSFGTNYPSTNAPRKSKRLGTDYPGTNAPRK